LIARDARPCVSYKFCVMEKFKNKYRIPSARASWWDYSQNGAYFITICTANRECLFGKIANNTMVLSSIGEIVICEWDKSFEIRSELFCDAFVIMPNHLHAILRIDNIVETYGPASLQMNHGRASLQMNHGRASLQMNHGVAYRSPKSISSFVAGFKSSATKQINEFRRNTCRDARPCVSMIWQPRFHDHIIRDDAEYQRIQDYIYNNPSKWHNDEFY
jgi:putative transposase